MIISKLSLSIANSEMNAYGLSGSFLWKMPEKKLRILEGSIITTDLIAASVL